MIINQLNYNNLTTTYIFTKYIIVFLFIISNITLYAQQPPVQEVVIEKEYEPVIRESNRIELLPTFQDTVKINLQFDYDIKSHVIHGQFTPKPIQPVKLTGEPLVPLQNFYGLFGVGSNYPSTIAQIRIGSLRNDNYQWFAGIDNNNSFGKMKDVNKKEVYAGYSNTELIARGKRFLKNATLEGSALYNYRQNYYYGYDTIMIKLDSILTSKEDIGKQCVSKFNSQVSIYSFDTNKTALRYNIGFDFNHLQAQPKDLETKLNSKVLEDNFKLNVYVDKYFNAQFLGVQSNIKYFKNENLIDSMNNFFVDFNPWVGLFGNKWRIQAGINTTFDNEKDTLLMYPNVKLHYNIESYFLVPYIEVTGNYQINSFEKIIEENYFILPNLAVHPTNNKFIFSGGMRGMASSRLGFNINATYKSVDNQYFYVIDATDSLGRFFNVEYDNMNVFTIGGELSWKQSDQLNIIIRGSYSDYSMTSLEYPWHTPKAAIDLFARYRFFKELTVSTNIFYRGERFIKVRVSNEAKTLDPIIDMNWMGEYKIDKNFTCFLKMNNILFRKQYIWENYQLHSFNVKVGVIIQF